MEKDVYGSVVSVLNSMGVEIIGSCSADAWNTDPLVSSVVPAEKRPGSFMPGCRSVIVFGIPVQKSIVNTAPSIWYKEHYNALNSYLDHCALRVAMELENAGFSAVSVPRDGYNGVKALKKSPSTFFSHRHAVYLAGLGTFGLNNVILTERYGPRIRFVSVFTTAVLPYSEPLKKQICNRCGKCVKACPVGALSTIMYPEASTDVVKCIERTDGLAAEGKYPCGICIAVCPAGKDRAELPGPDALETVRKY